MNYIFFSQYVTKSVRDKEENFGTWLYDYWWLLLLSVIVIGFLIFQLYKHLTRNHTITLYVCKSTSTIEIQHGKTFSAPIPEGNGKFKGWYRDTAYTIPFNSSDKIVSDFSLYAKFE